MAINILKHQLVILPDIQLLLLFFSKVFPKEQQENLAFSIILFWLEGNIASPVRYSYLSILLDDRADIFAASLFVSY